MLADPDQAEETNEVPAASDMQPGDAFTAPGAMDPGAALAQPAEEPEPDTTGPVSDIAEAGMVAEFEELVMAPRFLMEAFTEMGDDRNYVAYDSMMLDTQDTVAVNQVLRNQEVLMGMTFPSNPECSCQPEDTVGDMVDPLTSAFAETAEKFANRMAKRGGLQRVFEGAMQDAMTIGISWVKASIQEDLYRDPIGNPRFRDQQGNVVQYQRLQDMFAKGKFTADDPRYAELKALEDTLRAFAVGKIYDDMAKNPPAVAPAMAGGMLVLQPVDDPRADRIVALQNGEPVDITMLPEIPQQLCYTFDSVQPEDLRWDWKITKPEDFRLGDWMAHRVFMTDEEIYERFGLSNDDLIRADQYMLNGNKIVRANGEDKNPSERTDYESNALNNRRAVWELWHRRHCRVYVWVSGMNKFAKNYVPESTWDEFFPFFPLYFHRVTGQALPLSDTKLQRNLQDEYNMLRSHDREARRSSYPVLFIPKGLLSPGEIAKYENRLPFSVIEAERAMEVKDAFQESSALPYNPMHFNPSNVQRDMQIMAGVPLQAAGVSDGGGTELATEMAIANERLNQANDRRTVIVNRVLTDIFRFIIQTGVRVFPENYVKAMLGPAAFWPDLDANSVLTNIKVDVKAGTTGAPNKQKELQLWTQFAGIAQQLMLPVNGVAVLKEILAAMGLKVDLSKFILPMLPGAPMPGAPAGQEQNGPPAGPGPNGSQGPPPPSKMNPGTPGTGPKGGAPPMSMRPSPRPSQIPNRPPQAAQ